MANRIVSAWGQLLELSPGTEDRKHVGADRRLSVRHVCDVETSCKPAKEPDTEPLAARICNISRRGIGLLLVRPFDPGAILRIELPGDAASPRASVLACVVHTRPEADNQWALGCSFVYELSNEELQPFGAKRLEPEADDQRAWVRFPCHAEASYRRMRIKERQRRPAWVTDLSVCGAGLVVQEPMELGTVLDLELKGQSYQQPLRLLACVVRAREQEGEWFLGCNFIRQIAESELEAIRGNQA
jgi:hypothetical protein